MRWIYFILVALAAVLVQTTVGQVLWIPTSLGWVHPVFPASVAVFVGLYARGATDAALAGWALGFAMDLTGSGGGMGLSALLYALAAAGLYRIRGAFFRERVVTQMLLGFLFCVFVHELWVAYDAAIFGAGSHGRMAFQALGISAYTAVVTPPVFALLRRVERAIVAPPAAGGRR